VSSLASDWFTPRPHHALLHVEKKNPPALSFPTSSFVPHLIVSPCTKVVRIHSPSILPPPLASPPHCCHPTPCLPLLHPLKGRQSRCKARTSTKAAGERDCLVVEDDRGGRCVLASADAAHVATCSVGERGSPPLPRQAKGAVVGRLLPRALFSPPPRCSLRI
jgi:hypothetical protein